jgi:hypothetical protein
VIAPNPYAHSITAHALPNKPLIDQGAGYAGAGVGWLASFLACPPVRLRLLRAAWRPCSRGPARRARCRPEACSLSLFALWFTVVVPFYCFVLAYLAEGGRGSAR